MTVFMCKRLYTRRDEKMNENNQVDKGGFLWGLLGCCIPLAGLILFLVWKSSRPKTAKAVGIGALVSVGVTVLFYVLMMVLGVGIAAMGA